MSDVERRREVGAGEVADAEHLSESDAIASSTPLGGQAGAASGGYGTGSALQSSGGSGDATDDSSTPGADAPTEWLRDAPGHRDEAGGER